MLIGLLADVHDHLDYLRRAVDVFNAAGCQQVLFAGDLVSTIAVPPLRRLICPLFGCFGDNEGNRPGLLAGMSVVGSLVEPPCIFTCADGTRIALAHMKRQLRELADTYDLAVVGHTHRWGRTQDSRNRWIINPGETSGWSFGTPTVAMLDVTKRSVAWFDLRRESRVCLGSASYDERSNRAQDEQ